MPNGTSQTHNFLINYETTATRAAQDMSAITRSLQEQVQWVETLTHGYQRLTQAESTRALVRASGPRQRPRQTVFTGGPGGDVGVSREELFVQREYMRTKAQQADLEAFQRAQTPAGEMAARMEGQGITLENQIKITERYHEVLGESLGPQQAFARAQREVAQELRNTGEAAQTSGNWLSRYLQRYLIRYLVVWQAMRVVQDIIGNISEAQRAMTETTFRLGTAMQGTGQDAQQYLQTLASIASQTTVAPSALAGGVLQGRRMGTMAAQLAQATGAEPTQWMQHLVMLRDEYGLTVDEIEGMLDRMVVAQASWALQGKDYFGDYQQALRETATSVGALADALERVPPPSIMDQFSRLFQLGTLIRQQAYAFEQRPEEQQLKLQREFAREQGLTGMEQRIGRGGGVTTFPGFYEWLAKQPSAGPTMTAHEQWRLTGVAPGDRPQLGIEGFGGRMTGTEAERYEDLIQKWDAYFLEQGHNLTKQTITLVTEIGQPLKEISGSAEASKMALEEMNERQKTAVYNWPGNVAMVAMGLGAATGGARISRGGAPADDVWNQELVDSLMVGPYNPFARSYEHGGVVDKTGPAIVHKGETVIPEGQSSIGSLRLQSDIYLDGNHVAQSVSTRLGNQLYQAQRAAGG